MLLMKFWKRATSALLAVCMMLTCFACGENTGVAMTVDGFDVRAGIYLYYVVNAYNDAMQVLQDGGETFDDCKSTKDVKKIMDKADIDAVTAEEWIQNKAANYCVEYVAIEKEFERLNLKLTGEELAQIDASLASSKSYLGDFFTDTGIGDQSLKDVLTSSYKRNAIWEAYYGEGGSLDIQDQTLYDYYAENNIRIKYIEMPLKDGEGNLLKADGKSEIENMAKDFLSRLEKKESKEADLMTEFDYLIDENANYVTSLSNAAVTTTDENGSTVTTETTAKVTTDSNGLSTDTTTTTTATTTLATTGTESGGTTTTTTTVVTLGYEIGKEKVLPVSTSATEGTPASHATTTTTATDPSYTPCEKVYRWAVDEKTPFNTPELIQDEECYYIAMKMDIKDRMTSNDLWSTSTVENVRQTIYSDAFDDLVDTFWEKYENQRNKRAFKRYHVLDVDVIAYQTAMMQSYYSQYGYGG